MKGLPFVAEMARAALRDVDPKTQTRRVIVPQPDAATESIVEHNGTWQAKRTSPDIEGLTLHLGDLRCDYKVGERRCLLTTWAVDNTFDDRKPTDIALDDIMGASGSTFWHAGMTPRKPLCNVPPLGKSRPGRFLPNHLRPLMPQFDIISVRAERVQEIGYSGMKAEGCLPSQIVGGEQAVLQREYWAPLWDSINQDRGYSWAANPWVWVIAFRRVQP